MIFLEQEDERVSIEISVAENVFVSIKTSAKSYDEVLADAREIAKELKDGLCEMCKHRETNSTKLYG